MIKTEIFEKFSRFFFAVSVQNHEDIVESDNNMWKKVYYEKLFQKNQFLIVFIAKSMKILDIVFSK